MEPKISVCIPHYNGRDVISRCLRSIFTQTVFNPADVEIVVVDDCSTDGSFDVLQEYARDKVIKLLRNETRLGLTSNWNRALREGRGEVVCLLHQDDWYDQHTLSTVIALFQQHYDLAMASFGQVHHPADGSPSKEAPRLQIGLFPGLKYFQLNMNLQDTPAPSTAFFRRSYLSALDVYYDPQYLFCSELDLYLRLSLMYQEAKFAHDSANLVQRGLSAERFSVRHPGYRILDFCRILKTYLPLLNKDGDGEITLDAARRQIVADVKAMVKLGDMSQLKMVMENSDFQNWIRSEPRHEVMIMQTLQEIINSSPGVKVMRKLDLRPLPEKPRESDQVKINQRSRYVSDVLFTPVLIVGFHHAGTRLISQFLQDMGVFQVVDRQTSIWGYIQDLNTEILPGWNDPQALRSFDHHEGSFKISPLQIADLLVKKGYHGNTLWGHSDPRTCATLDAWLEAFPSASVVHIMRDPLDVLGTLPEDYAKFTPGNHLPQEDLPFWADLWMAYLERILAAAPGAEKFIELRFEDLCLQPRLEMLRLAHDLGLPDNNSVKLDGIKSGKIGIHAKWIEEGRLDPTDVELLKVVLGDYRQRYGYGISTAHRAKRRAAQETTPESESVPAI
ncbi:MAG: glycosyltransferase [bacterium]|nr:glycosyltransferase [bacterium]